ncbi:MAG: DUF4124 domain-containing protein [Chromatiales bacterium]|nr:DUF4124 domain-containing protein [Chromatiales bacterium]
MRRILLCLLPYLLTAAPLAAADVYRCTDTNGRVTFTQQPCERGMREDIVRMKRPAPPPVTNDLPTTPPAEPPPPAQEEPPQEETTPADEAAAPSLTLPEAIEQGKVVEGMTQEDVLRALENATRGSGSRHGPDISVRREGAAEYWEFRNRADGWPASIRFEQGRVAGAE